MFRSVGRGMSLLEVVVSISILSIAALAIVLTVTRVMVAQSSSSHHTVARLIAEAELERAALAGSGTWDTTSDPPIQVELARVGQNPRDTEFRYQVFASEISKQNEGGTDIFPAGPDMGQLWELEVRVWWNAEDSGPESAVERGVQSLSISKLVYDEM